MSLERCAKCEYGKWWKTNEGTKGRPSIYAHVKCSHCGKRTHSEYASKYDKPAWCKINEELEKCPDCGQTIDKGACFYCKMD